MSQHITEDLLKRFVDGDVDEAVAIAVGRHLDDCARCATHAASIEPLAAAFASLDDPFVPPDLADQVVEAWHRSQAYHHEVRTPATELVASSILLSIAAALLLLLGDPAGLVAELIVAGTGLVTAGSILMGRLLSTPGWALALAAMAFLTCLVAAWRIGRGPVFSGPHQRQTV